MSHNELNRISMHIEKLVNLKALVLNNNKIKVVDYLGSLLELNTIVLSHNRIQTLPSFPLLTKLTKLSAAHNEIRQIPDLSENGMLKELRLNHNKLLTIPDSLRRCTALDILDLGGNMLREWSDVAALGSLMHLVNLNLQGNPICDKPDYKKKVTFFLMIIWVLYILVHIFNNASTNVLALSF
jgi:Leucine-rich repeat (LRR) protein